MFSHRHALLIAGCLLLAACEDPSNVGIGLLEEDLEKDRPGVVVVHAASLEDEPAEVITGSVGTGTVGDNRPRVLAGSVTDPLFGTIGTTGYVDFSRPSGISDAFRNGTVAAAELRFTRRYVYGDTTGTVTLRLNDMPAEWDPANAAADTTLAAGENVTAFSFPAADTLVVVPLPESWAAANDTTLRSTAFDTSFHGFQLEHTAGTAVVGFDRNATLRVVAGEDTVDFPMYKVLTSISRTGAPQLPPDRLALQDGIGPGAVLAFDFDDVADNAVNRAVFRLHADTTTLTQNAPPGFYRPPLQSLVLLGVSEDGRPVLRPNGDPAFFRSASLDSAGRFTLDAAELTTVVQQMLLGTTRIARFQVRPGSVGVTLNPALLYTITVEDKAPEAVLTLSGVEQ